MIAGLVGHERRDQHQLGARREFDFSVVVFILVFGACQDKNGTSQSGDDGNAAEKLAPDRHYSHTPFIPGILAFVDHTTTYTEFNKENVN